MANDMAYDSDESSGGGSASSNPRRLSYASFSDDEELQQAGKVQLPSPVEAPPVREAKTAKKKKAVPAKKSAAASIRGPEKKAKVSKVSKKAAGPSILKKKKKV